MGTKYYKVKVSNFTRNITKTPLVRFGWNQVAPVSTCTEYVPGLLTLPVLTVLVMFYVCAWFYDSHSCLFYDVCPHVVARLLVSWRFFYLGSQKSSILFYSCFVIVSSIVFGSILAVQFLSVLFSSILSSLYSLVYSVNQIIYCFYVNFT